VAHGFDLRTHYDALVRISQEAFAAGHVEVAYHSLASALHCADAAHDLSRAGEIERLAREQLAWLDANTPTHRLATRSTVARGGRSMYEMLQTQAHATAARIRFQLAQIELHAARSPDSPAAER
jgi:hypothetical protein